MSELNFNFKFGPAWVFSPS